MEVQSAWDLDAEWILPRVMQVCYVVESHGICDFGIADSRPRLKFSVSN